MPYTLGKVFVWYALAGLVGAAIGWTLHHLLQCSKKGHGAGAAVVADTAEVDRLQARIANLEPAVQDRDNLRLELAALQAKAAVPVPVAAFAGVAQADHDSVIAERDGALAAHNALLAERNAVNEERVRLQGMLDGQAATINQHEAVIVAHQATISAHEANVGRMQGLLDTSAAAGPPQPDLSAGEAALGLKIKMDDLKVVEGIGPKIEELCHGKGIRTWWGLANTDTGLLRSMLDEAGSRFQMHDPSSWPAQANLLAHGRWAEFKELTDRLDAGRGAD